MVCENVSVILETSESFWQEVIIRNETSSSEGKNERKV